MITTATSNTAAEVLPLAVLIPCMYALLLSPELGILQNQGWRFYRLVLTTSSQEVIVIVPSSPQR